VANNFFFSLGTDPIYFSQFFVQKKTLARAKARPGRRIIVFRENMRSCSERGAEKIKTHKVDFFKLAYNA
jgi:hypothetical protein